MRLMNNTRKTFGETAAENQLNNDINIKTIEDDIRHAREKWEKDLIKNRDATIARTLQDPKFHNKNFYIAIHFLKHRLVNEPGSLIVARHSCPTPVYNQAVYKYNRSAHGLEFLWSIPDKIEYYWLLANLQNLPSEKQDAAKFCHLMESGDLEKWVIKENGNKPDGLIQDTNNKPYVVKEDEACQKQLILQP